MRGPRARETVWSRSPPGDDAVGDDRSVTDGQHVERRWADIRGRMEAASEVLSLRGSIASRLTPGGTRVYSVRFSERGEKRQRAVYLGPDGELVRRARALIQAYRERERQVREVEEAARFVVGCGALLRRMPSTPRPRSARPGES
jgi:hypothetical protein